MRDPLKPGRRGRSGFTLFELLIAISIVAIVGSVATSTLLAVAALANTSVAAPSEIRRIGDLGRAFRSDAHASATATVDGEGLLFVIAGEEVRYSATESGITRVRVGRPAERFPLRGVAAFTVTEGIARLSLRSEDEDAIGMLPLQLDAGIGLAAASTRQPEETP